MSVKLTTEQQNEAIQVAFKHGFSKAAFLNEKQVSADFRKLYEDYLRQKFHGDLFYLEKPENLEAKFNFQTIWPDCKSVFVLAHSYLHHETLAALQASPYKIARYAWGRDYHSLLKSKMKALARELDWPAFRPVVDSTPLPERYLAHRAQIGTIGKNGMLIIKGQGSYHLLAFMLLPYEVVSFASEKSWQDSITDTCGSCRRCIDACPTMALPGNGLLEANKCISYQTIENKNEEIDQIKSKKHRWIFGCDICQTVCPYNSEPLFTLERQFAPREITKQVGRGDLKGLVDADLFGSPLSRPGLKRLQRNINYVDRQAVSPIKKSDSNE